MMKFFYSLLIGGAYLFGLLIFLLSSNISHSVAFILILGATCIVFYHLKSYK